MFTEANNKRNTANDVVQFALGSGATCHITQQNESLNEIYTGEPTVLETLEGEIETTTFGILKREFDNGVKIKLDHVTLIPLVCMSLMNTSRLIKKRFYDCT